MYLRWRQWLRQIVVMCHIACWFRSGAVLNLTGFITQASFKPSLGLFPRKCTCAKVIDLRNMVLWRIGLQIDIASHPPNQPVSATVCYDQVCFEKVCYESGLFWTGLLWMGLLWTWSILNGLLWVVFYERVCYEWEPIWSTATVTSFELFTVIGFIAKAPSYWR